MGVFEKLDQEWREAKTDVGRALHHAQPQPTFTARTQTATPAQSQQPQPEVPRMSIGNDIHRIAAVVEKFGENGINILEAVANNNEMVTLIVAGARIAGLPLQAGTIAAAANGLQVIEKTWNAAQAAQQGTPAQAPAQQPQQPAQAPGTQKIM